ncbi:MAG: hypothetical protein ACR2NN_22185 [Bryobacteraceae bacterium]
MMPTKFVPAAVAVLTDALSQFPDLGNKFFTCHLVEAGVHYVVPHKAFQQVQWTGVNGVAQSRVRFLARRSKRHALPSDVLGRDGPVRLCRAR